MQTTEKIIIQSSEEHLACLLDYNTDKTELNTIIMHGGGPSCKENTEYLISTLLMALLQKPSRKKWQFKKKT